jgi:hypothetical protein
MNIAAAVVVIGKKEGQAPDGNINQLRVNRSQCI